MPQAAAVPSRKRRIYRHLYFQVLCAIAIGVLLGYFYPSFGAQLKPLGDMFIQAIKMVIAPIIFCTVVHGIASMKDMKKVGRVGLKAIVYFEVVNGATAMAARPAMAVYENDWLQTGADGELGVTFRDSTRISLGPNSRIQLTHFVFKPAALEYGFRGSDGSARRHQDIRAHRIARKIGESAIIAVASADYLERRGEPKRPSDLDGHDGVIFVSQERSAALDLRQSRRPDFFPSDSVLSKR